jgi:predicted adenine nucleotide alpha hydrolase (AANH) superfamily ATPase
MGDPGAPKPRLLLHVCCGPCSTTSIERLQAEYDVLLYWYNPNIADVEEYRRRLAEARRYAGIVGVTLIEGPHDTGAWEAAAQGLMDEPEGGRRCDACFRLRLGAAARVAQEQGIELLTTTLTISPHKPLAKAQAAAEHALAGTAVTYVPIDFRKQGGFERSRELSREHNLYRQDFCGCEPSRREREKRRHR